MSGIRTLINPPEKTPSALLTCGGYSEKMAINEEVGSHTPNLPGP